MVNHRERHPEKTNRQNACHRIHVIRAPQHLAYFLDYIAFLAASVGDAAFGENLLHDWKFVSSSLDAAVHFRQVFGVERAAALGVEEEREIFVEIAILTSSLVGTKGHRRRRPTHPR